jgi:hypothetical protein
MYEPPQNWECTAIARDDGGFLLLTDLDFDEIQAVHVAQFPDSKVFGLGDLMGIVIDMHEELQAQC